MELSVPVSNRTTDTWDIHSPPEESVLSCTTAMFNNHHTSHTPSTAQRNFFILAWATRKSSMFAPQPLPGTLWENSREETRYSWLLPSGNAKSNASSGAFHQLQSLGTILELHIPPCRVPPYLQSWYKACLLMELWLSWREKETIPKPTPTGTHNEWDCPIWEDKTLTAAWSCPCQSQPGRHSDPANLSD